ncbi:DUF3024 domain-containing protein [Marinoscillum furvescens]|uniref:DUF3024 family protein n=1 Tax=Marinoscillum furvescens DSM 4134 TaxID=1122208 RepID=A0A3D9L1V8_MARFU|nr:DUF3024 domain-containing protein [Marinoscillum furvescens]RED97892.1 hypothetical protein C7460_11133 [Marinoscillum furvescens DSM 4134]
MALDVIQAADTINELENFLDRKRPAEHIRDQLDIAYKIDNQSIIIHEVRPAFEDPDRTIEPPIAKATWVHTRNEWKVFWMRGNLKWSSYQAKPTVKSIKDFIKLVEEDSHYCFWG